MRILAVNASHRGDKGHTRAFIDRLFAGATAAGADCEVVTLARLKINRCLACAKCQTTHPGRCVWDDKDDVRAVFDQMAQADILVYGTPVYIFAMSGLLKTFLDRLYARGVNTDMRLSNSGLVFHGIDRAVCSKPFVSLVVCANVENETPRNAIAYFRTYARFMDAPHVGELLRNATTMLGSDDAEHQFPRLVQVYAAYAQAGRELATEGRIRRATQRQANQEIAPVPFFGLLKRFRPVKQRIIAYTRQMGETDVANE
ncbi:MAG: flavodoxin family protein [Chloroflexi bacterium]|nr:flavodoxin family protein [Chloroflexota bacterium]